MCQKASARCNGQDVQRVRIVGDASRRTHTLCAGCRTVYEASPFVFEFAPASTPEWQMRGREGRLPAKVGWAA